MAHGSQMAAGKKGALLPGILRALNPNVPAGAGKDALPRVPRDTNALRQLREEVRSVPEARVLLAGHIGVGKSTELNWLAREMAKERHVVECQVGESIGLHSLNNLTLLLAIAEAAIRSWTPEVGSCPPGLLEDSASRIRDLGAEKKRPERRSLRTMDEIAAAVAELSGMVSSPIRSREDLAALYGRALQRLGTRSLTSAQLAGLDFGGIGEGCRVLFAELAAVAKKPVLLVIDGLDKIREESVQEELLLDPAMLWRRLPGGTIASVPIDVPFARWGGALDNEWSIHILDPLPVPEALVDRGPPEMRALGALHDEALQWYLKVLESVGAHQVFSRLQCRRLAAAASGLPRTFVQLCSACVRYASEAGEAHVRDHHIGLCIHDLTNLWRGRLIDSDYVALHELLHSGGGLAPEARSLLRDGVLIRDASTPSGEQFRLAAWVKPLLEGYRQRQGLGGSPGLGGRAQVGS